MAKLVKISDLAKELGVESKAIIAKLKSEELAPPTLRSGMSTISVGLAETVREWVRDGKLVASPGGVAVQDKPARTTRKKKAEAPGGAGGEMHAAATDDAAEAGGPEGTQLAEPDETAAADMETTAQGTGAESSTSESADAEHAAVAEPAATGPGASGGAAMPAETVAAGGENRATAVPPAAVAKSAEPGKPAVKKVVPVPFTPEQAKLAGPRLVKDESPIVIERPRFGQKLPSRPKTGSGTAAAPEKPGTAATPAAAGVTAPVTGTAAGAGTGGAAAVKPAGGAGVASPAAGTDKPAAPGAGAGVGSGAGAAAAVARAGAGGAGVVGQPAAGQAGVAGAPAAPGSGSGVAIRRDRLAPDGTVLKEQQRPTVSLNNPATLPRGPIVRPPQVVPEPAKVQGPRVVRIEAPEPVPPPRPPRGPRPTDGPAYPTARPDVGRGVRTTAVDDEESESKKAAAKGRGSLSARRRGLDGRRGEAEERLKEFTEADLIARQDMLNAAAATRAGMESHLRKSETRGTHVTAKTAVQRGGAVEVEEPITPRSLSAALGVKVNDLIFRLMKKRVMATVNTTLTVDQAMELALDYGLELKVKEQPSLEEKLLREYEEKQAASKNRVPRPPVVTILGHVDHGKTSLLDKIRNANVAAGEAGGITQHIAAWTVRVGEGENAKRVTFIDTPGHQAFTSMRARGANMTDVVVLVVSAAEGVQPQTIESINHARAAEVPIVVALNKIDRPDANPEMVLGQLAANGINPVEWGGDVEVVRCSALTGQGIPELIEILDYQSQLLELTADPTLPAKGTVIEARRDEGLGPVATVLVQEGTLKVGAYVLCGPGYGRVRSLLDDRGVMVQEAGPSTPVIVSGLSDLPSAGDVLIEVSDLEEARAIAEERATRLRQKQLASMQQRTTMADLMQSMRAGEVQTINLIIKADTQGSVETLVKSVTESNTEEVKVRVIHAAVGAITESDVELAIATKAKPTDNRVAIIGFHVVPDEAARTLAEQHHIDVKTYRVIYEIFDDLKKALSGMLAPEEREKYHGRAEIRQVFKVSRVGNIAGCMVIDGHVQRGSKVRLIRNGAVVVEDLSIESLKRLKDDVREVKQGFECGIKLAGYDDIKVGDVLEMYVKETFERTL
ncbi:MAG: translation initiation factor IF-2 [Tepidisphaerales bacterium]